MLKALLRRPFRRRTNREEGGEAAELEAIATTEEKAFHYDALAAATGNFSDELAGSAFGQAFRGRLRDGREVVLKRLPLPALRLAEGNAAAEFVKVAAALSRMQHRNVAALHGYCVHGRVGFLVYEHLPSLDKFIFHSAIERPAALDWPCRYDVIRGLARGLAYLHDGANVAVLHGRLNAGTVLLSDRRVAKIGDFGSMSFGAAADARIGSHAGVDGHTAPEYAMHGQLSPKADIYSFGVVVLEVVSGRDIASPVAVDDVAGDRSLLEWAWRLHRSRQISQIMDPTVRSTAEMDQLKQCVHVGLLCVQADPKLRPDMKRVVVGLSKKHAVTLEEPAWPGKSGVRYRRRALLPPQRRREHHQEEESGCS